MRNLRAEALVQVLSHPEMRTHLKEIILSIAAILIMIAAIIFFFKAMKTGQSGGREEMYRLITPDADALMVINRPGVFERMMLRNRSIYNVFASAVPPEFLSFIRHNPQMPLMVISYHPQGTVCYIKADNKTANALQESLRQGGKTFPPVKQTKGGLDYYYYPFAENRFLGCFTHNGIRVCSFSRKLLENAAGMIQKNTLSIPPEMNAILKTFDENTPANILFPTKDMDLTIREGDTPLWRIDGQWLGADLFVSEDGLCCYGSLPYRENIPSTLYRAMGDTIAQRVKQLYPQITLSFQLDKQGERVYYTGCTALN